jgi:site-specific recombinase XerD
MDVHEGTVVVRSDETHQTKTAAERTVHVSPEAQSILERLSEARDPTGEDFIFQGPESDQLSHALTSRYFRKYRRKVGLSDDLTFPSLRHTTGSWLSMRGVPLRHIQDILGHSSTSVTEIYSHLAPMTLDRAMEETFGSD